VLNEVLALERRGLRLRIFSLKDPKDEPVHADAKQVRAKIQYLSLRRHWKPILEGNVRTLRRWPGAYLHTLLWVLLRPRPRWGLLRNFLQAGYLADLLAGQPVGHLHAHFASAPATVAMLVHHLTRIPYTFTAHAKDIYFDRQPALLRSKMRHAQAVVTISEYNRRHLRSLLEPVARSKVHCIYNGADLSQYKPRSSGEKQNGVSMILSVARLIEKKGLDDLIRAAHILRQRGRAFCIEIIGSGPLRQALEVRAAELGVADSVKFLGARPQEFVREAYERAALFALPCVVSEGGDRDGIPTVLLEAMASEVPVVSTTVSGIPELVESGHDGLLVPPGNPAMLADALDRLLLDPNLRRNLGRAGRTKVRERFSINRSAAQLVKLFQPEGSYEDSVSVL
jgi:glycosyltransferase involved in cell wall biosynthesis